MSFFDFRNREESQKHFFANGRFSGLFFVHRLPDNRNLFDNPRLTDSPCLIGNLSVTCRNDERFWVELTAARLHRYRTCFPFLGAAERLPKHHLRRKGTSTFWYKYKKMKKLIAKYLSATVIVEHTHLIRDCMPNYRDTSPEVIIIQ